MAIQFDSSSNGTTTSTSPLKWNHICTGTNLVLIIAVVVRASSGPNCTGITYNNISLTLLGSKRTTGASPNAQISLWYLLNPAIGSNEISVSFTGSTVSCNAGAVSWTGVSQSGQPDAVNGVSNGVSANPSITITTISDNCWVVGGLASTRSPTPVLTDRWTGAVSLNFGSLEDTNGNVTPAGDQVVSWTSTTTLYGISVASFSPADETITSVKDIISSGFIPFAR